MLSLLIGLLILCVWLVYGGLTMAFIQDKFDKWNISPFISFGVWFFVLWAPVIVSIHFLGGFA